MKEKTAQYNTVQIEAAENGWIVKCVPPRGIVPRVFVRWESVVIYIESLLTTGPKNPAKEP